MYVSNLNFHDHDWIHVFIIECVLLFPLQYLNCDIYFHFSVDITRWKVSAMISLDLAKEAIDRDLDRHLTAACVKVFLLCASQYHMCLQNVHTHTQSNEERNNARVQHIFERLLNWLTKCCSNWIKLDEFLKVNVTF